MEITQIRRYSFDERIKEKGPCKGWVAGVGHEERQMRMAEVQVKIFNGYLQQGRCYATAASLRDNGYFGNVDNQS